MERKTDNPNLSSFADFWKSIDPAEQHAINRYQEIAGAYNDLWKAIYLRTETKSWENDPQKLGSCAISDIDSLQGMPDLILADMAELRNRRSNETSGGRNSIGCPHHRKESGCVLEELKGPYCIDYVDFYLDDEIEERFGLCLMPIMPYLERVVSVEEEDLSSRVISSMIQVQEFIETFPILNNH